MFSKIFVLFTVFFKYSHSSHIISVFLKKSIKEPYTNLSINGRLPSIEYREMKWEREREWEREWERETGNG